ncbi:MAG: hypothetical protein OSA07_10690, partial [Pseudomonadales bacterium]|nr:hypothetical protein [Pseudomonadales bacterium]
ALKSEKPSSPNKMGTGLYGISRMIATPQRLKKCRIANSIDGHYTSDKNSESIQKTSTHR